MAQSATGRKEALHRRWRVCPAAAPGGGALACPRVLRAPRPPCVGHRGASLRDRDKTAARHGGGAGITWRAGTVAGHTRPPAASRVNESMDASNAPQQPRARWARSAPSAPSHDGRRRAAMRSPPHDRAATS